MTPTPPTFEQVVAAIARLEAKRAPPKPPDPAPEGKRRIIVAPPEVPKVEPPAPPPPEPEPPPPPVKVYRGEEAQAIAATIEPPRPHADPVAAKLREELEARAADEALVDELLGGIEHAPQVAPSEGSPAQRLEPVPKVQSPAASSPQPSAMPAPSGVPELARQSQAMPTTDKPPRPTCIFPGCVRPYWAKQLCSSHYPYWRKRMPELLRYIERGEVPPPANKAKPPRESEPHKMSPPIAEIDLSKLTPPRAPQPAKCVAEGCRNKPERRGLCAYHYKKQANEAYRARLRERNAEPQPRSACIDCGKLEHRAKGRCSACYERLRRLERGEVRAPRVRAAAISERYRKGEQPRRCTELGCTQSTVARGLCRNHWRKWRTAVRDAEPARAPRPNPESETPMAQPRTVLVPAPATPAPTLDASRTRAIVSAAADVAAALAGLSADERSRALEVARLLLGS
jgi:hypothetical protein